MADIEVTRNGAIATILLNRPAKKNALTDQMQRDIGDALIEADLDPAIALVVIEAAGDDFCAGNDLSMIAGMASGALSVEDLAVDHFLGALSTFGKPLLAAVRGRAIGVGATLLLHCDAVIVTHDARIVFGFVDLSLVPEAACTYLLPAAVGYARAYALLCMGQPLSGREAASIGMVSRSVDNQELSQTVTELGAQLASKSPTALRATKQLMKDKDAIASALTRDKAMLIQQLKTALRPSATGSIGVSLARNENSGGQR